MKKGTMKIYLVALIMIVLSGIFAGCGSPAETANVESADKNETPIEAMRQYIIKNGASVTDGDYKLSKQSSKNGAKIEFSIITEKGLALTDEGLDKEAEGIGFSYEILVDGITHNFIIHVYDNREYFKWDYTTRGGDKDLMLMGKIKPQGYTNDGSITVGGWLNYTKEGAKELVSSALPVLLAGIETILSDNALPYTLGDFGFSK